MKDKTHEQKDIQELEAEVESWKDAYHNMRKFAEDSGLDVTSYHGP